MTYLYDGSFEGFLTLVYDSYTTKRSATKIIKDPHDIDLLDALSSIITNRTYATKVLQSLQKRFEKRYFKRIFHTFLCDSRDFEKALYDFVILGFRDQKLLEDIRHPSIFYLEKLEHEYFRHLHKMYGFVRFEELENGTLYAKIEGKFNLLPFLGKHFQKRLDGLDFILHDTDRSLAYLCHEEKGLIQEVVEYEAPTLSKEELKFQKLWKTFLKSVTIQERKNPKLQQSWVPLLYRQYMLEFD